MTWSLEELQRAADALTGGEFRTGATIPRRRPSAKEWRPDSRVIVVAGATGRAGTTTLALAIAEATAGPVRLLDCATPHRTGLADAPTAELGVTEDGWRRGNRGDVVIERPATPARTPEDLPVPESTTAALTVIDAGWDLHTITASDSWLATATHTARLIVTTVATVPGLRSLGLVLREVGRTDVAVAVLGDKRRRWPRELHQAAAATGRHDDWHHLPLDRGLAVTGVTPAPLPPDLVAAARPLLGDTVAELTKGNLHVLPV